MIYFYYGENLYTLEEKLKLFRERYAKKFSSGLNFVSLDFEEESLDMFRAAVETYSMFEEKKLIFVRGTFSLKEKNWENLKEIIKKNNLFKDQEVVVLFYEKETKDVLQKKSKKLFAYLSKEANTEEFNNFSGTRLLSWLKARIKASGGNFSDSALRILVSRVGGDSLRLMAETEKLLLYKGNKRVDDADVELLISTVTTSNIFKTIDALAKKDTSSALRHLQDHWVLGDDPMALLAMFSYELRVLLLLKEAKSNKNGSVTLEKTFKLHPYVIKKNSAMAENFTLDELKLMYRRLAKADLAIKTGRKEPQEALIDFVYQAGKP